MPHIPLERTLSKLGVASRTQARAWIVAGEVTVDDRVCTDPQLAVDPSTVRLTHRGAILRPAGMRTLMLHKPRGVVCTRVDEKGKKTVFDLHPEEFAGLHSVGRLDRATSGLLLMTNDTRLSAFLTNPANGIPRVYVVTVRDRVDAACAERMLGGVEDRGEDLHAGAVTIRKASNRESHLVMTLTEGKNREIRRLCAALGHEVTRLKRVAFGNLELGELAPGAWRVVEEGEILHFDAKAIS